MKWRRQKNHGSILILALWTLTFLSVFAVHIGLRIRQRAAFLVRIENKSQLHYIAVAGVRKAMAALRLDAKRADKNKRAYGKFYRHNNAEIFGGIVVGSGTCDIVYTHFKELRSSGQRRYGVVDEEGKININTAEPKVLRRLIARVTEVTDDRAAAMAEAIIDWRELGASRLTGFYTDDYYANLQYPYAPKSAPFELIDELLVVRGFPPEVFNKIKPFITIYGDGRVNINTAVPQVLDALGLDQDVINKILLTRRGVDDQDATIDDYIFQKTFDISTEIKRLMDIEEDEMRQIDTLNQHEKLKTESSYFLINARAQLIDRDEKSLTISCVYNTKDQRIEYWRER